MGLLQGAKWLFGASLGEGSSFGQEEEEKAFGVSQFGLGFGKVGFGLPRFCSGSGSGSVGPISWLFSGSVSKSSVFSCPDLAKASMVDDRQFRLEEANLMAFDNEEASSTMFDQQICLEETTSTVSDCSNKGSGSSTVFALSTGSSGYAKFDDFANLLSLTKLQRCLPCRLGLLGFLGMPLWRSHMMTLLGKIHKPGSMGG